MYIRKEIKVPLKELLKLLNLIEQRGKQIVKTRARKKAGKKEELVESPVESNRGVTRGRKA